MQAVENEIMTVQELARYLRLAEATVYKLAQAGEIPGVRVGRTWRFKRELIDVGFRDTIYAAHHSRRRAPIRGRKPRGVELKPEDVQALEALLRDGKTEQRKARRARISLGMHKGERVKQ